MQDVDGYKVLYYTVVTHYYISCFNAVTDLIVVLSYQCTVKLQVQVSSPLLCFQIYVTVQNTATQLSTNVTAIDVRIIQCVKQLLLVNRTVAVIMSKV
jgi:hypothetical protein